MDKSKLKRKVRYDKDTELIRMLVSGDIKAFDLIYRKYHPFLKKIFAKYNDQYMSSDDLAQEVFIRLWRQRSNFRGESCFVTYLLSIARYTVNEKIKHSQRINVRNLDECRYINRKINKRMSQPETELYLKELAIALKEARDKLTIKEQQALEVSKESDITFHKASQKLGCSLEALKSRIKRARKRSQELIIQILNSE